MKRVILALLLLCLLIASAGCKLKEEKETAARPAGAKLNVVATLYPVYDFAREVAGEKASVTMLLPPGVEPHSFEPRPEDVARVSKADVVIYTSEYMEPWAVKLLKTVATNPETVEAGKGVKFINTSTGEEGGHGEEAQGHAGQHGSGGVDPHIWLDFANAQAMVRNIAVGLMKKDPANKDYYQSRATAYQQQLQKLDDDFKSGLAECKKRTVLDGGHHAFGYLALRYGLIYHSAQALNPDAEPTPQKLAELVKEMRSKGLKYVYTDELLSPATAEMIARETGGQVLMLNAAHNVSRQDLEKGTSFILLMRQNLENLRKGLECS